MCSTHVSTPAIKKAILHMKFARTPSGAVGVGQSRDASDVVLFVASP
jgi:hypothetical protein